MSLESEYLDLFEGNEDDYKKFCKSIKKTIFTKKECNHENVNIIEDTQICNDCGMQNQSVSYEAEWRFYGSSDTRNIKDPSRCHGTNKPTKTINQVIESRYIPNFIVNAMQKKYDAIVKKDTSRGKARRALIAVCELFVYRDMGDDRDVDEIRALYDLKRKDISTAMTKYYAEYPKDLLKHLKPCDLIKRYILLSEVPMEHYAHIYKLAKYLDNSSTILNHSNPRSVASSVIFLYLCMFPKLKSKLKLSRSTFAKKVGLSEITITKLTKEASQVINENIVI